MADMSFVVAFAQKSTSETSQSALESATHLRNLLDTALNGKPKSFTRKLSVSVAPGGVMFALPDTNPDRAVELCQAVARQLEHQARTHHVIPAVCAVITYGWLRPLSVLGLSANFEGWPAIAAARVLAKLSPGECAVEQSVWAFTTLQGQCGDAKVLPGKSHDAEAFHVRMHRHIQFPTPSEARTVAATPSPAELPSVSLSPYEEFAHEVKERIQTVLQEPYMHNICEAITKEGQGKAAEDVLVPAQPDDLLNAMYRLHRAVRNYLTMLAERPVETRIKQRVKEILGWQVLLVVNREILPTRKLAFDPWQDGIKKNIPLRLEISIEALVSSLGNRAADFVLRYDNQKQPRVAGAGSFRVDDCVEGGISHRDQLTGILQRIWGEVMKPEPIPAVFSTHEKLRLHARLKGNEGRDKRYYYISIPEDSAHALRVDQTLVARLQEVLPSLRLMQLVGTRDVGLLLIDEYDFHDAIEELLKLLEDKPAGDTP